MADKGKFAPSISHGGNENIAEQACDLTFLYFSLPGAFFSL